MKVILRHRSLLLFVSCILLDLPARKAVKRKAVADAVSGRASERGTGRKIAPAGPLESGGNPLSISHAPVNPASA